MNEIVIGTRGSVLALWQTNHIIDKLAAILPECRFKIVPITTKGDKIRDKWLAQIGGKGVFVRQIELALLEKEIDIAVHSMKDLPTKLPDGLTIGAIVERDDPADVLISDKGYNFSSLPPGAKVGTSSLRRRAQLLHFRPELEFENLRGNVDTRISKLKSEDFDGIVLASAGVKRLSGKIDLEEVNIETLPFEICLPAVGQGAIGVELREEDSELQKVLEKINHFESYTAVIAERAFLRRLGGGCQIPIGALGKLENKTVFLEGLVADVDGNRIIRSNISGEPQKAESLGEELAEVLINQGAKELDYGHTDQLNRNFIQFKH